MKFISIMIAVAVVAAAVYFGLNQLAPSPHAVADYSSASQPAAE